MEKTNNPYVVKSVIRCLTVLEHIAGAVGSEATVRGVSRSFGISEGATLKILRTLETRSFIERDTPSGPYRLGYGTLMLREAYLQRQKKQKVLAARPLLELMAAQTGETAYLARFGHCGPVCENVVVSSQAVRVVCKKGMPFALENTAVGKVMLAYARGATNYRQEIEERGYAANLGESDPEVTAVAAPVRNHLGTVIAVLGIAGPKFRLGLERVVEEVAPVIVTAAKELSHRLGFAEPPALSPPAPPQPPQVVSRRPSSSWMATLQA